MRTLPEPSVDELDVSEVLHALADPVRLELLAVLADGREHTCGPHEYDLGIHKSTLSHHLAVMRQAGLTRTRLDGRRRWIRLRRDEIDSRFPGLLAAVLAAGDQPRDQPARS